MVIEWFYQFIIISAIFLFFFLFFFFFSIYFFWDCSSIMGDLVCLDYNSLINDLDNPEKRDALFKEIEKAFGKQDNCLGIIAIKGIPNYTTLRSNLLPLAARFANLEEEQKKKCVVGNPEHACGWSHGVEKFQGKLGNLLLLFFSFVFVHLYYSFCFLFETTWENYDNFIDLSFFLFSFLFVSIRYFKRILLC